jgi:crotonobetainyl-CoA:carnitine CoA-transferase CaiB-like acyl-CoA transferase
VTRTTQPQNNQGMTDKLASGPLVGVKVLELGHVMAGPVCGMMLADMGADVIKLEKTSGGDDSRRMIPPEIKNESAAFLVLNRNKRGIAVDLKSPDGIEIVKKLIQEVDILIENFRLGTMERLGLDYRLIQKLNPALVYCSLSGFGRSGPYASRGGFDLVAQGMSGLMSITGQRHDQAPVKVGPPVTDITAGILGAMGVLAAYLHRLKTGEGQLVDTSLYEAGIVQTYFHSAIFLATGESPGPIGSAHIMSAPYQAFPTADGWITIGAANQANWLRLVDVIEAPELLKDQRFTENADRMAHLDALSAALESYFRRRTSNDWLSRFEKAGLPAGPICNIEEVLKDRQTAAREMLVEVPHKTLGNMKAIGAPIKFSTTPGAVLRGAPVLGEHTREILSEIGFSAEEINQLKSDGVVKTAD